MPYEHFTWRAKVTALSSIAHGGEALGAVTYLRRERFLSSEGTVDIPIISGNAWRGLLRRTAADLWWEAAGRPKLTTAVMHAIWSGGALAKASGTPITGGRVQEVRRVCPVIALFGASGGGRILDGAVQVGKMLPICDATAHVLPDGGLPKENLPSLWDITQIEYYSKIPSVLEHRDDVVNNADSDPLPPARFGVETFIAGSQFSTWLSGDWLTDAEMSLLCETIKTFESSARVGGYQRMGMGEVRFDWENNLPEFDTAAGWRSSLPQIGADERGVLAWLD